MGSGIIIPIWQPYQEGSEIFSFSVDFGTTNTHIEYMVGKGSPKPFDITPDDIQIATLFHPKKTTADFGGTGAIAIRELIEHEFVPEYLGFVPEHLRNRSAEYLGNGLEFKFPHRTVIAESDSLDIKTETFTLADFNIPFIYERKPHKDRIHSNLKWVKKEADNLHLKRVRAYFENIIMLLRNKVLFNRGKLSKTRLIWFYPSSMKEGRRSELKKTWENLFKEYFNPVENQSDKNPSGIAESLAPFYYFKGANKLSGGAFKPVVSIDIGGGTTDIVVFKSNKPLLMTSFKFAANTIFGDGFSEYGAARSNGLINKYLPYYEQVLSTNKLHDLSKVLSSLKEKNKAEDINAFFFSIENNSRIKDKSLFSYNSLLARDEDLKILFIYFYSAIIYHVAEIMKYKNVELPKHLIFSGTGSRMLNIITKELKFLENLSKKIFEKVHGRGFDSDADLTISMELDIPKEVTCKGGLMTTPEDLSIDTDNIKTTLTCLESKGIDKLSYNQLEDALKEEIVLYVRKFNKLFLSLNKEYSFNRYFTASERSIKIFEDEINKNLREYLEQGLAYNRKLDGEETNDKEIEESLFFYPLIGAISNLVTRLSKLSNVEI